MLKELLLEWSFVFGDQPTTVRKVIKKLTNEKHNGDEKSGLYQALFELPIIDRGDINPSKLGWFLKKNANRIINGYEFQQCDADGRTAWRVVHVKSLNSPQISVE